MEAFDASRCLVGQCEESVSYFLPHPALGGTDGAGMTDVSDAEGFGCRTGPGPPWQEVFFTHHEVHVDRDSSMPILDESEGPDDGVGNTLRLEDASQLVKALARRPLVPRRISHSR